MIHPPHPLIQATAFPAGNAEAERQAETMAFMGDLLPSIVGACVEQLFHLFPALMANTAW
jgi:hypothetical protein